MMKSRYKNSVSFTGKTRIVLVLVGIIPFLLVVYLFVYERIQISDMIVLFAALVLFSILAGFSLLRSSADSLAHLATKTRDMETWATNDPIQIRGDQELTDIADHFNAMLGQLQEGQKNIKEQSLQLIVYARDLSQSYRKAKDEERIRNRLSRYVGENLVEKLIHEKNELLLENERKEVTILFADIRSFTTIAERMPAEEVVSMLNQFFSIMVDIVFKNQGILDKFIGDQLMAVFGLMPSENPYSLNAVNTAIEMQNATEALMIERAEQKQETFGIGIGINTGDAIVGNVGSKNRMDYTTIGDSVNIAARLQEIAKRGEIIIGEETYRQTQGHFRMKKKVKLHLKNKTEPVICYEVPR
jgi:adenylate cyclase